MSCASKAPSVPSRAVSTQSGVMASTHAKDVAWSCLAAHPNLMPDAVGPALTKNCPKRM